MEFIFKAWNSLWKQTLLADLQPAEHLEIVGRKMGNGIMPMSELLRRLPAQTFSSQGLRSQLEGMRSCC